MMTTVHIRLFPYTTSDILLLVLQLKQMQLGVSASHVFFLLFNSPGNLHTVPTPVMQVTSPLSLSLSVSLTVFLHTAVDQNI